MNAHSMFPSGFGAALLAGVSVASAQPEPEPEPALERVPAGAQVLHCGVARGVLYVTYLQDQRAAIAPAFHTPALRKACADAGYPLAAGPPGRVTAAPLPAPRIGVAPSPREGSGAPSLSTAQPSFVAHASGSVISIDGRNDADVSFHCVLNFAWASDDEPGGSRGVTTQATLPARQSQRVVTLSGPYNNMRFVGQPRWSCTPGG
jgi:hypothetical protein